MCSLKCCSHSAVVFFRCFTYLRRLSFFCFERTTSFFQPLSNSIFNTKIDFAGIMNLSQSSLCRIGVWKTRPYSKSLMFSDPNHNYTTLWSITDHKRPHLFTYSHHRSSTTPSEKCSPFCHTLLFVDNKYKLLIKKSRSKLTFKCNKKRRIL